RPAPAATLTVTVVDSPAVMVAGSNDTVTPAGVTPAAKVIASGSPLTSAVLAVGVAGAPGAADAVAGGRGRAQAVPVAQPSAPATFTAVQAARTALYSVLQKPYRSVAAERV